MASAPALPPEGVSGAGDGRGGGGVEGAGERGALWGSVVAIAVVVVLSMTAIVVPASLPALSFTPGAYVVLGRGAERDESEGGLERRADLWLRATFGR
jgi:hypothetical protein